MIDEQVRVRTRIRNLNALRDAIDDLRRAVDALDADAERVGYKMRLDGEWWRAYHDCLRAVDAKQYDAEHDAVRLGGLSR